MRPLLPSLVQMTQVALVALVLGTATVGLAGEPVERPLRNAAATSLPRPGEAPFLGVVVSGGRGGLRVVHVVSGSPAASTALEVGDTLVSIGGRRLRVTPDLDRALAPLAPGERTEIRALRGSRRITGSVRLGSRTLKSSTFGEPRYRLGVVQVEFSDDPVGVDRSGKIRRLLLDRRDVRGEGATMADYFRSQSGGRLEIVGEVLAPVRVSGPRSRYARTPMGGARGSLFHEAAERLVARIGQREVARYHGLAFVFAGSGAARSGTALWPHRSIVKVGGRRLSYYAHGVDEPGGDTIGVHCHEFGHLLGLGDEYGVGHRTGSGDFCLMAIGHRGGGASGSKSPFSLCAVCRMRLGWVRPVVVDPRRPQRLRLDPVRPGAATVAAIPLDAGSREYLLLEVRSRTGFDRALPSAGLLVWHVGGESTPGRGPYRSHVDLVEAHGVDTFDASLLDTSRIAFPTARARDLTPHTRPALRSRAGGIPAYLTSIVRRPGGAVAFTVGVARSVSQAPPRRSSLSSFAGEGAVIRTDPITGQLVRFYPYRGGGGIGSTVGDDVGEERR